MPRKLLFYRLRLVLSIAVIWIVFGIVFFENLIRPGNDLGVQVSLTRFILAFGIIGFLVTGILVFYLKPAFNHQPVWLSSLLKLLINIFILVLISFLLLMVYFVFMYPGNFQDYINSFFTKIVQTRTFAIFFLDMGLMTLLSISFLEVTDKYGPGMFWSTLIGKYHKPINENRIYIFLDINESTAIAEELGHEKYFRMLRRFFADVTMSVLANDGEIYQYVGDEIVITWPNTAENKLKSLKFIRNAFYLLERNGKKYQKFYGRVPTFKAGVHAGEVTSGFIGVIKKELIYSGDTLNTTARICSKCHDLNESYLLSEYFMQDFSQPHGYNIEPIVQMKLRGHLGVTQLFSMKFD
ncbi:MAG: adenylate/guanylate cyclase domain-containing protein [Bacteroidota bacterium]|nr:adenylate/guanylate cyclase domain-containing protein [Bacteroidota bacterium]